MRKGTKLILGISVALITAATLHLTVGERFHKNRHFGPGHFNCGPNWSKYRDKACNPKEQPVHTPHKIN